MVRAERLSMTNPTSNNRPLSSSFARSLFAVAVTAIMAGCGTSGAPEVSDFELDQKQVAPGGIVNGTAMVSDTDGDLDGGTLSVTLVTPSGARQTQEQPINLHGQESSLAGSKVSLSVAMMVLTPETGAGTIELRVIDSEGHESNVETATITLTSGKSK